MVYEVLLDNGDAEKTDSALTRALQADWTAIDALSNTHRIRGLGVMHSEGFVSSGGENAQPFRVHLNELADCAHRGSVLCRTRRARLEQMSSNFLAALVFSILFLRPEATVAQTSTTAAQEVNDFVRIDATQQKEVRLLHVNVIDGTGGPEQHDQTLTLAAGKIASIAPSGSENADGRTSFDLKGYTVLPGLVGMHDHLFYVARSKDNAEHQTAYPTLLPQMTYSAPILYLANGVTTLRTTGSVEPYADLNLKAAIESHQVAGPHMDVTGPYIQGEGNPFLQMHTLHGAEETRRFVDYWADQGVTSFKAYTHLTRTELKAAIDWSHRRGLKITGHLCSITYPEAAELGIDNLEHGFMMNTQLNPKKQPDQCPVGRGFLAYAAPDGPEAQDLIALLVNKHVAVTSTLPVFEEDGGINPPLEQRWLDVMTPQARETYLYERNAASTAARSAFQNYHATVYKRELAMELAFVRAGGLLMAGPDPTGDGHIIPGFGDQREIELLVDAGFSPLQAIQIGTLNGATYLGRADRIGSVTKGKNADLMLVKGNPGLRIADIENVEIVFQDGLGYDSKRMLAAVKGLYGLY